MEVYSGYDPAWIFAHSPAYWVQEMLDENVIPPSSRLLRMNGDIEWVTEEEANDILLWLVPQTMAHHEMGSTIAVAEEYRCFEDFDSRTSNQKKDFYRKWYHTQTQHPQISLDGFKTDYAEEHDGLEWDIEDESANFENESTVKILAEQFMETLSEKDNAYAQDYKDLSSLKKIADNHGICIFVVHHTRKERDGGNIFNDMTGSTGIMGVADTGMILRKDDRFGDNATLCITGRDVEEKKLKMQMRGVKWEITEELSAEDLRKERIPDFVFKVVDFLFEHRKYEGTVSELLAAVGNTELKPNVASKYLTRFYSEVFAPLGITYEYRKTAAARTISLSLNDGADGNDGVSGLERLASLRAKNDGISSLPVLPSQSSFASWEEISADEDLPW